MIETIDSNEEQRNKNDYGEGNRDSKAKQPSNSRRDYQEEDTHREVHICKGSLLKEKRYYREGEKQGQQKQKQELQKQKQGLRK